MSRCVRPSHEPIETSAIRASHFVSGNLPKDLIMAVVSRTRPNGLATNASISAETAASCFPYASACATPLMVRQESKLTPESGRRCSTRFRHAEPNRFLFATTSKRTTCKVWFQHFYSGRHSAVTGSSHLTAFRQRRPKPGHSRRSFGFPTPVTCSCRLNSVSGRPGAAGE